ncbi:MAG: hypothetical protein FD149_761 [Rhodospirillaceae bacterium]|nr:MAG: hypothetical protein FD149_761 [Rhodospirillaceae bacterium]
MILGQPVEDALLGALKLAVELFSQPVDVHGDGICGLMDAMKRALPLAADERPFVWIIDPKKTRKEYSPSGLRLAHIGMKRSQGKSFRSMDRFAMQADVKTFAFLFRCHTQAHDRLDPEQ